MAPQPWVVLTGRALAFTFYYLKLWLGKVNLFSGPEGAKSYWLKSILNP